MNRLSGWARLWIVGSVLWWIVAGALTASALYANQPRLPVQDHRECIAEKVPYVAASHLEAWLECDREYQASAERQMHERLLNEDRRAYVLPVLLSLAFVVVAPFLFWLAASGVYRVVRWVWRGFKPS